MEITSVAPVLPPAAASEAAPVGWAPEAGVENGPQEALVQATARPPVAPADAPRGADALLPRALHDLAEFALPAAQLQPVVLVGLQVEATHGWPLCHPDGAPAARPPAQEDAAEREPRRHGRRDPAPEPAADDEATHDDTHAPAAPAAIEAPASDTFDTLARTLREVLTAHVPPPAALAAAEQWRRGRCVVMACPQGIDPAGPAWAFALWPRAVRSPAGAALPLALHGVRVDARLQWHVAPHDAPWRHVRVVKEHHPRHGRQLVACDGEASHLACVVQLGPVLVPSARAGDVCVRIDAVQRFWNALGGQWSMHVVVCALPLAGVRDPEDLPC